MISFAICGIAYFVYSRHAYPKQNIPLQNTSAIPVPEPIPIPTAIDPNFMTQVSDCFLPVAAFYGYSLRITSGFRSLAEQQQLYAQGRTINGHIVTEAIPSKSIHNYGYAVDVVDRWSGYNINWTRLGNIGTYCGLEQGPDGDLPHLEHRAGLTTDDFIAGKRPPPLALPCPIMTVRAKANHPLTRTDLKNCGTPKF